MKCASTLTGFHRLTLVASCLFLGGIVIGSGCDQAPPSEPVANGSPRNEVAADQDDPLQTVLSLAKSDMEAAVKRFVEESDNWVESCTLEDFQMSEEGFRQTTEKRTELQQTFIERVAEIRSLARAVLARAEALAAEGETDQAQAHVAAVNRFGEQLRDADLVQVYQQVGSVLAEMKLEQ